MALIYAMGVLYVLGLVGPFVGYLLMLRDPRRPRWHVVVGAIIGGGLPATVWGAASAFGGMSPAASLPYVVAFMIYGALIGLGGLGVRTFGKWLSRPSE
jgi:hypothetical protein